MELLNLSLLVTLGLVIALNALAILWLIKIMRPFVHFGGPYVPTSMDRVEDMIRLAHISGADTVYDLGSGDGRLVIAAAEAGAKRAVGVEIDGKLVRKSRASASKAGVGDKTEFRHGSFWKTDVSPADVVLLFQIPFAMKKIGEKLEKELKPGARVICNGFPIKEWKAIEEHEGNYLYVMK